jgi:hypothetical protein
LRTQKNAHVVPFASARQHPENQKENQAGHSPERAVEGQRRNGRTWNCNHGGDAGMREFFFQLKRRPPPKPPPRHHPAPAPLSTPRFEMRPRSEKPVPPRFLWLHQVLCPPREKIFGAGGA